MRSNPPPHFGIGKESIWIFVSTIGELNAIEPFLRIFVAETQSTPVTLLTDRLIYRDSYRTAYPEAYVYEMDGTSADIDRLIALTPPALLLIAEIPCLLSDAPCRFPFAAVYGAKRAGAPVALINGWIYGYAPLSRLDAIERRMLGRDYLRLMDLITVQNEDVRQRMIGEGAVPARLHVTGNTKFDAVVRQQWSPQGKRSEAILRSIVDGGRPCIVAGCVTDYEDQMMVLDAFGLVVKQVPDALLVLAPRHPENKAMMAKLEAVLTERGWRHLFRSRVAGAPLASDTQILILDTMGEAQGFLRGRHRLLCRSRPQYPRAPDVRQAGDDFARMGSHLSELSRVHDASWHGKRERIGLTSRARELLDAGPESARDPSRICRANRSKPVAPEGCHFEEPPTDPADPAAFGAQRRGRQSVNHALEWGNGKSRAGRRDASELQRAWRFAYQRQIDRDVDPADGLDEALVQCEETLGALNLN